MKVVGIVSHSLNFDVRRLAASTSQWLVNPQRVANAMQAAMWRDVSTGAWYILIP